jgi:hypothetical protein
MVDQASAYLAGVVETLGELDLMDPHRGLTILPELLGSVPDVPPPPSVRVASATSRRATVEAQSLDSVQALNSAAQLLRDAGVIKDRELADLRRRIADRSKGGDAG